MNRRLLGGVALLAIASQALGGCATSEVAIQTELARAKAEQMNEVAARPAAPANVSPVKVRDAVYMGAEVTHSDHGMPLPPSLERKSMSLHKGQTMGFQEIAGLIARETRVPVSVAVSTPTGGSSGPVASGAGASPYGGGGGPSMMAPSQPPTASMPPSQVRGLANGPLPANFDVNQAAAAILAGQGSSPAAQPQVMPQQITGIDNSYGDLGVPGRMRVDFDGSLPQFLDLVSTNYNVAWEYIGGQIVFERAQMRIFDVASLPILTKESFSLSSGSGSDSSGSGAKSTGDAKQTASTETSSDIQADIKGALDTIVTDGAYKLNNRTGQVTVLASPATLRRVSTYLKELNNQLSKQVAINVKVYSVVLSDGDNYQNQIQQALSSGGNGFAYGTGGTFTGGTAASNVSSSTAAAGNIGWAILSPTSRFAGTQGLLTALSTKGDVSVVTSASVLARNGFPVPVQSANTRGYVKSIQINQGSTGGALGSSVAPTAQVETSTITTGFNLHLTPNIMKNGSILLQYGINISDLVGANNGFDNYSVLGENVQLPNVNQRNFIQEASIPNGSTLVLSGFEQVRASAQVAGPVSPSLFLLGGSDVANLKREILVIAITPTLLDMSAAANPPATR